MLARKAASLAFAALLAWPVSVSADDAAGPDAVGLLNAVLARPQIPFQGRISSREWQGNHFHVEEATVFFQPPRSYRVEYMAPDGHVTRIVISDGQRDEVQRVEGGKVVDRQWNIAAPSLLSPDEERALLLSNYKVRVAGRDSVLSRPVWILELSPNDPAKPTQRWWVDRETKVVLESRRLANHGTSGQASEFSRFSTAGSVRPELFAIDLGGDLRTQSTDVPPAEAKADPKATASAPAHLPGGFSLAGGDLFTVDGAEVRHLKYTDGLLPLSLFETTVPVRFSSGATPSEPSFAPPLLTVAAERVQTWNARGHYYTLIGAVEPDLFSRIQPSVK